MSLHTPSDFIVLNTGAWERRGFQVRLKSEESYINIVSNSEFKLSVFFKGEVYEVSESENFIVDRVSSNELTIERVGSSSFKSSKSFLVKKEGALESEDVVTFSVDGSDTYGPSIYLGYELEDNDYLIKESGTRETIKRRTVFFTSFGLDNQPLKNFEFLNFIGNRDVNALFLRDNTRNWFQGGILGFSSSKNDTADKIEQYLDGCFDNEFIGVSMGGFAALAYGLLLKAKKVTVISPQTRLDKKFRARIGDNRWGRYLDYVERTLTPYNLKECLENNSTTEVEVFVSKHDSLDMAHIEDISNFNNVKVNIIDYQDHYLARELAKTGELSKIIFGEGE